MKDNIKHNRRDFLLKGAQFGLVATAGGVMLTKYFSEPVHSSNTGDMIELMTTDGNLVLVPKSQVEEHHNESAYNPREGFADKKFVMVVDLAKCKNAKKCQEACNKGHYITGENAWLKIYKTQESEETSPYWMPTQCQHCDQPPCVKVCPVDATFKRKDGIVLIDNERCIGCRFCMAACPYSVRIFNWEEPKQYELTMEEEEPYTPDYCGKPSVKGTVDKCDFCPHEIVKGELPFCVKACPNNVFSFGDMYEDAVTNGSGETFKLSTLLKDRGAHRYLEGLGTEPSVYYLPPVDRTDDFEVGLENYTPNQSVFRNPEE